MGQSPANSLTDREAEIMERLWELGTATAEQIRMKLPDEPHDSTVRTILRILEEKGFVSHERAGRSFIYQPLIQREKVQRKTLVDVIRQFFSGSPHDLVLRLLAELNELMNQFKQGRKR
jgi:BlaI family penicillinase repressor